jgi:uncharacterized membrane protein
MIYLNFILTVLCIILLLFLVFGAILVKKIVESVRKGKNSTFDKLKEFSNQMNALNQGFGQRRN